MRFFLQGGSPRPHVGTYRQGRGRVVRSTAIIIDAAGGQHKGRKCTVLVDCRYGSNKMKSNVELFLRKAEMPDSGLATKVIEHVGDRLTIEVAGSEADIARIIEMGRAVGWIIDCWYPTSTNVPRPFAATQCSGSGEVKPRKRLAHEIESQRSLDREIVENRKGLNRASKPCVNWE